MCRLCISAAITAIVALAGHPAAAALPADWPERLQLAISVSHQGYADSSFEDRAQDSAISMASALLAKADSLVPSETPARIAIWAALGDFSFRGGEYRDAYNYWRQAREKSTDEALDLTLRLALPVIAGHGSVLDSAQLVEAQNLYTHLLHECPPDSLNQLWMLAHLCENMWLFGEARFLHERVAAIAEAHPEADCRWAIRSLVTLGEFTSKRLGIPHVTNPSTLQDSAVALAERALGLARARFGTTDTLFAYVADRLGDYYVRLGRDADAVALWDSAWAANRIHLPPEHIELQGNLDRMASVRRSQGRFLEAEALAKQALELRKKTRGEGHPEVASMYTNLGHTYQSTGKYREAENCYLAALRIREDAIERSTPLIADSHRRLAQLYYDDGQYALADEHFRSAINMMKDALGERHSWVASCLRSLSAMCTTWGRPEESLGALNDALSIYSQFLGEQHPAMASTLEEIARTELLLGHIEEAGAALDRALHIDSAAVAAGAIPQVSILTTKARVLLAANLPAQAESLLHVVLNMNGGNTRDPQSIDELALLARAQTDQGLYSKARSTYSDIFAIDSFYHGLNVVAIADARDQYARFLLDRGESVAALDASVAALRQRVGFLDEAGEVLSESQALRFERAMHRSRDIMLSAYFASRAEVDDDPEIVYDLLITSKGAISNHIFERERRSRQSNTSGIVALRDSLHAARHQLATIYMNGPGELPSTEYALKVDSIRSSKGDLEQRLAQCLGQTRSRDHSLVTTANDIRRRLPAGSTLVEYVGYQNAGFGHGNRYAALIVPDSGEITLRDLGDSAPIDSLIDVYQEHMETVSGRGVPPGRLDAEAYGPIARGLYAQIWEPIAPMLRTNAPVIVAPDAEIYLLSFAGLLDSGGRYLIEGRPIHFLSCGRSLADVHDATPGGGALVLCDPDFEAEPELRAHAIQSDLLADAALGPVGEFVTRRASCDRFVDRNFLRLPGTRDEGEAVRAQLSEHDIGPITVLADAAASEENLKRCARNRRLLHLATHGFFLGQDCAPGESSDRDESRAAVVGENPLLLSGLCLAGANRGSDTLTLTGEDGILTAEEVASLSLDGTEWVVLSACDTRLGATRHGEGVFGLQRAFQMAGAHTVISSLWPVSDRATASFMRSLYSESHEPLYQVMRLCQLGAIGELRRRGQPDHPYNWAGFVAVGGWNPLN